MTTFKRSQAAYVKQSYQTTNWPEYEAGLRQRGSLTVWISEDELNGVPLQGAHRANDAQPHAAGAEGGGENRLQDNAREPSGGLNRSRGGQSCDQIRAVHQRTSGPRGLGLRSLPIERIPEVLVPRHPLRECRWVWVGSNRHAGSPEAEL
jgi:hypothetical protein